MSPSLCASVFLMMTICTSQFLVAQVTLPNIAQTKPFLFPVTKPFIVTSTTTTATQPSVSANVSAFTQTTNQQTVSTASSPTSDSSPTTSMFNLTTLGFLSTTPTTDNVTDVPFNSTDNLDEDDIVQEEFGVHLSTSNCSQFNNTGCGMSSQDKIVGGTLASPHEFPWLAHLIIKKGSRLALCTGFLVTNRHVITAAHCTKEADDDSVRLTLGTNNPSNDDDGDVDVDDDALRLRSIKIVTHPDYDEHGNLNDVSVITVDKPVTFTDIVRPICLPTGDDTYVGVKAKIAGWGTLAEEGQITNRLMKATVPVLDNTDSMCVESYGQSLKPQMICAGGGSMDTCQGDSGGPLMVSKKGIFTAIGIVSFGIGCGRPSTPGVYARITALMSFIDAQISDGKPCSDNHIVAK